jgi:hypothetical protein
MKDTKKQIVLAELIQKELDGCLTDQEFNLLQSMLKEDKEVVDYYVKTIRAISAFSSNSIVPSLESVEDGKLQVESFQSGIWKALAEQEKAAPAAEVIVSQEPKIMIQKVQYQKLDRKISRLPIVTAMASFAALLLIFVYVYLNPQPTEVATLADSIGVKCEDAESSMQIGYRFLTAQRPIILKSGIIKVLYNNDVEVLLEAPAEFQFRSANEMYLKVGALFAKVSPAGKGFTVLTQNAKIVDLGTEFGVSCDAQKKTQLHVFKGKTTLTSSSDKSAKNLGVLSGQAREVDVAGNIKEIRLNKDVFVRAIDSKTNMVLRKNSVDLADMAGMGNGLGTGKSSVIIHPTKGYTKDVESGFIRPREFLPITDNPYVDGIFVPNNENAELIVSTRGDIFKGVPKTSGLHSIDLVVNPEPGLFAGGSRSGTIEFDGQVYGAGGKPCINMHANIGLTFDLDAIRKHYQCGINRFTSRIGIADLNEDYACNADFYVLLDGRICYSLRQYKQKGALNDVSVEINDTDRFLTLVTTDGGDPDYPEGGCYKRSNSCDWCVFTEPVLMLE